MNMFSHFLGNEQGKEYLARSLIGGSLPHALLLTGQPGLGKRTLAGLIGCGILCRGENPPCGECRSCHSARKESNPDIIRKAGKGTARSFSISQIREIKEDANLAPVSGDKKVYILENAQEMTVEAQNALLKILEEPPTGVYFILTADSAEHLLSTIRSRVVELPVREIGEGDCVAALRREYPDLPEEELCRVVTLCRGNLGRGKAFLSDEVSRVGVTAFEGGVSALCSGDEYALLEAFSTLEDGKTAALVTFELLSEAISDAIRIKSGSVGGKQEQAVRLASRFSRKKLLALYDASVLFREGVDRNANYTLLLTQMSSRLFSAVED